MNAPGLGTQQEEGTGVPRITWLPFFYTAPVALLFAGGLLLAWGSLALATPWSSFTVALTHSVTLGFLTMTGLGVFYALASELPGIARPRSSHVVYYGLLLGAVGLVWGTARAQSAPVFFAIGAVGLAGVVFILQAGLALRRSGARGLEFRALRLALWGFSLAAFLGVWLAHGHGGMRFPGLRSLWMQVHLCIALLGWLGGMLVSASLIVLPRTFGTDALSPRVFRALIGMTKVGILVPFVLLLYGYFFIPDQRQAGIEPWATAGLVPALVAIWLVHPVVCLRALDKAKGMPGSAHWRAGLLLGPLVMGVGAAAWFQADVRLGMLFGWLAVFGWGATLFSGLFVGTVPGLLFSSVPVRGDRPSSPGWLLPAARAGLVLHGLALLAGAVGILAGSDPWCRFAGGLMGAEGAWLLLALGRALVESRSHPPMPA